MFFAFALQNPDMEFLVYFVLPVKVKWLAILDAIFLLYQVFGNVVRGIYYMNHGNLTMSGMSFSIALAIIVAMGNFLAYFFASRDYRRISPANVRRRRQFKQKVRRGMKEAGGTRHRCAVCGRTELDDETLEFRYCSKCDGNYEYCSQHLFTHQHVKK